MNECCAGWISGDEGISTASALDDAVATEPFELFLVNVPPPFVRRRGRARGIRVIEFAVERGM